MRARTLKALRICFVAAAVLWLAWLVAGNVWLNLGVIGRPFLSTREVEVRVGPAFTWWPGQVRGRDLRVVIHDSAVELDLRVDRFDLAIAMTALTKKQLHTTRTNLAGLSLRVRGTRPLPELCREPQGLPPIFGQADPPGASVAACLAQRETALPKGAPPRVEELFHVALEGLDVAGLREVWIETLRVRGEVALQGNWAFWPKKELEIYLRDLTAHDAVVTRGARTLAEKLDVDLAGRLERLALANLEAKDLWRSISARWSLRLDSFELKSIRGLLLQANPIAPPKFPELDGLANLQSGLRLEAGRVRSFSLEAQAEQAAIALLDRRLKGSLRLRASLHESPEHPGRLLFTRSELSIRRPQLQEGTETQSFDDVAIDVQALGSSYLEPERQRADLDFSATVSQVKLVIALIPGGLPRTLAKLFLNGGAQATAKGLLHATADEAEVRDFQADASGLSLSGGFAFAPKLQGKLNAKFGPISADIPLSSGP